MLNRYKCLFIDLNLLNNKYLCKLFTLKRNTFSKNFMSIVDVIIISQQPVLSGNYKNHEINKNYN